jgi:TolB-like protein/Flp pilus assembly protein TadD
MNPRNFFAELKRRSVYKVAVAYAVVAWLLMQIASQIFPFFEIPNWAVRLVVLLLIIGFPIALIIAWAFELTPEGIKRTESADAAQEHSRGRIWIGVVFVAAALSLGLFLVGRFTARAPRPASDQLRSGEQIEPASPIAEKSVAVLPFDSLSEDKANAYFATGIEDEILTRLAKIGELKVISRTSTARYQSKPGNLSEIGKQLGVAHVLEGSVQKAGDAVRVNVQLINARNDSHIWAETYDRKLTDIFAVETEIAKSIAEQLQAKLTGHEQQALAVKPTNSPEAYDAYLRGLAAEGQYMHSVYAGFDAASSYERAVQLDPSFAVAWARLSRVDSDLYGSPDDPTPTRRDAAKRALEAAQKLEPSSPETQLALARYQFLVLRDYAAAEATYREVGKALPGNSDVPSTLAWMAKRQGRWEEATAYYEQALVLDPRNTDLLSFAAINYGDLRNFDAARKLCDRGLDVSPNDLDFMAAKAALYQAEGKIAEADKLLQNVNAVTPSITAVVPKIGQFWLERDHSGAIALLQTRFAQHPFRSDLEKGIFRAALAFSERFAGNDSAVKTAAEQARDILKPLCATQPENSFAALWLSRAYALLGDRNSAYAEANRAKQLDEKNAAVEPGDEENFALIDTIAGNNAKAISILARLLQVPYQSSVYQTPVTPALLRLDPLWDPLRSDPAFQKLCEQKEP